MWTFYNASGVAKTTLVPDYVTALPSSPVDGQEVYYAADATNGVIWHLRYRSGAAGTNYKWEYVGGGDMHSGPTPAVASPFSFGGTSWVTFTNGPTVTVPLEGDYAIEWWVHLQNQSAGAGAYDMAAGLSLAGADPSEYGSFVIPTAQYGGAPAGKLERRNAIPVSTALTIRLKTSIATANSSWARGATLAARPIRVK